MKLSSFAFLFCCISLFGEVRVLTLRQALDLALAQNPDLLLARLDQQKAHLQVTVTRDPFSPKVFAGSGAAWSTGFPNSIEGSAPSIVTVRTQMAIFNRPQSYLVAQANEDARGAGVDVARRQEEVIYRVASLYLDAEQASRSLEAARRQADNLKRVQELMAQRVAEGRELAIESKKANLAVLRAGQRADNLTVDLMTAESSLAMALGFGPDDRARVAAEERTPLVVPVSEEASIEKALEGSNELKRLESNMQSKMLEIKSYRAERLPKVNVVAQYSSVCEIQLPGLFRQISAQQCATGSVDRDSAAGGAGGAGAIAAGGTGHR